MSANQDSNPSSNNEALGSLLQNAQNSMAGLAWRSCRFCQRKAFVSSEGIAGHEANCRINPGQLQQQACNQYQYQHFLQLQQQRQQQQQLEPYISNQAALQLGPFMPTPFAPYNDAKTLGARLQGSNFQAEIQDPIPNMPSEDPESQFQAAIDSLPAFNIKRQSSSSAEYFPLAMPEDEAWLTPLHCFVRRYCVEVFVATPDEVSAPCMGKRNPVSVGQVGIRCPFCSPERVGKHVMTDIARARENGVVYPSIVHRIYNATINLLQRHLRTCQFAPPEIISRYEELKSSNARSGASKKYWAESALRLGLVDTPNGIHFDKNRSVSPSLIMKESVAASASQKHESPAPPLVLPSDKRYTTAFTFHLIAQMQACVFTEADRLGRRRGLEVGFAGLACRHCFGVYGSGRFFPSSIKTMSDASKTLNVIYKHVMKCKKCPSDIKVGLRNLREFHDSERSKMPFGNQRAFFTKIWGRLHENAANSPPPMVCLPVTSSFDATEQKPPADAAKIEDKNVDSIQVLYAAHFNKSSSYEHTKVVNEAA